MVKIVNQLGDVKVGRQGEAVYQRKYGEQIRRQVSPKRGIPSESQIAHRQLYRDALTWRSQLSLPNRRYLDGYCYANGIIDSYHIPLPWSRFALKLYLQAVKFVGKLETTGVAGQAGEKKDYNTFISWAQSGFGQNWWFMQSFTPLEDYTTGKLVLRLGRSGLPGIIDIGIRATDGAGKPTGGDLASGQTNGDTLPTNPSNEDREIVLSAYDLAKDVKYAIVGRALTAEFTYSIRAWQPSGSDTYPRGVKGQSSNSGVDWTLQTNDFCFEVWSATIPESKKTEGLLHVRHPALMTITHKRSGLSINGYDTLSSLDEEYLTGQVGLDVISGDTIKATTLPGIEYNYAIL